MNLASGKVISDATRQGRERYDPKINIASLCNRGFCCAVRRCSLPPCRANWRFWFLEVKRFTETTKWIDPWFMGLSPRAKLLWLYLLDHCDNSGVIEPNTKLASFQIGEPIKEEHFIELGNRLKSVSQKKLLIPKFIGFQFGSLVRESRVHCSIFKLLETHGIQYPIDTLSIPYVKGTDTLKVQDKDKEKEPDKAKEGVQGEIDAFPEVLNLPEFKAAWNRWHDHLKQKRKPATIHARDLQLAKLAKMGVSKAIVTLNHCIEHNWQGIYEPNTSGNGSSPTKPNPRNFGVCVGPTDYGTAKPRLQREIEEKRRLAEQVAANANSPPAT